MAWQCTQRSVLAYSGERYPDGAGGCTNNRRDCNGGQPSVVLDIDNKTLLVGFSGGASHEGINAIAGCRISYDGGRSFGDPALDTITIDQNPDPTKRSLFSSWRRLKYGKIGRIIAVGARGHVVGEEHYDSYLWWSDPDDRTVWNRVKLPQPESYYTIGISVDQLPSGRVLISAYTRRLGAAGARSYCFYSDDYGETIQTFEDYSIHPDPTTGDPGVIASDPAFVVEYKEPYLTVMPDGSVVCMVRSDDTLQKLRRTVSSDGGMTWTGLAIVLDGWNFPANMFLSDGTFVVTTRHRTGVPADGNDFPEMFMSSDKGLTFGAGIALYDPKLGIGSALGTGPLELPGGRLAVVLAWAAPGEIFTRWRLEFTIWENPAASAGNSNTRYDVDPNVVRPQQYLTSGGGANLAVFWHAVEQITSTYPTEGNLTRWKNLMGDPGWDLIPSPGHQMQFARGSIMLSPSGLTGGRGIVTSTGTQAMLADKPVLLAQPLCFFFVCDAQVPGLNCTLFDDAAGQGGFWKDSTKEFFINSNFSSKFWAAPAGFPPGKALIVMLLNGASSVVRVNGTALTAGSGGPLSGSSQLHAYRLGGANLCFFRGLREDCCAQISDLTKIAAYEQALIAKHGILR